MADGVVPTLELIDNSIADYRTSMDAMRWAPGLPEASVPMPQVQVRFEIDTAALVEAATRLRTAFVAIGEAVGEALKHLEPPARRAPSRRALWLLNRSRRKAQRRQARARYLHVRALDGWAGVAGVELQQWQRTLLAQAMRRERSHD